MTWSPSDLRRLVQPQSASDIRSAACLLSALRADLHRFAFLLGVTDGEELFGEPTP